MVTLEIVALDGVKLHERVYEVLLPTPDGQIAIFEDHMPLITLASEGVIGIRHKPEHPDDMIEYFATTGGVVELENNTVKVLVDAAAGEDELDEQEINEALERAHKMRDEATDQLSLENAQMMVDRSRTQLKVAELKRKSRRNKPTDVK